MINASPDPLRDDATLLVIAPHTETQSVTTDRAARTASPLVSGELRTVREAIGDPTTSMLGDVAIVTVRGELDLALCIKLAPELNAALRSPARAIVIDLEAVSLVDSSGIALLLNAFRRLDYTGASSRLPVRRGRSAAHSS